METRQQLKVVEMYSTQKFVSGIRPSFDTKLLQSSKKKSQDEGKGEMVVSARSSIKLSSGDVNLKHDTPEIS